MRVKNILEQTSNRVETEIFLSHLLDKDRSFLCAFPETVLTKSQVSKLQDFISRRKKGEPLAYILGYQDFYGLRFKVNKNVLIPRPETEALVDTIIKYAGIQTRSDLVLTDVGTGNGCIAISLVKHLPKAKIYAIDIDRKALEIAKENVKNYKVSTRIKVLQGDLLEPLTEKVDIIVANLPYIPSFRIQTLQIEVKNWEPKIALDGGKDGMRYYKKLFRQAEGFLNPGGIVFYEVDGKVYKKQY
jgi:release factor glutamine methyltransferase